MITTLINADEEEYAKDMEANYKALAFMQSYPRLAAILGWFDWLKFMFTCYVICRIKGHDLYDDGYGGPESGCIDIGCRRCGMSYGKQWLY